MLKVLLNNISQFFHLSSSESISDVLVQRYYCKNEDLLNILKPILEAIVDVEAASNELLQKAFGRVAQFIDGLRELYETWQPLGSKVYFVWSNIYALYLLNKTDDPFVLIHNQHTE